MLNRVMIAVGVLLAYQTTSLLAADITIEITTDRQYVQTLPSTANPSGKQHNVKVVIDQTIVWINRDNVLHTVSSDLRVEGDAGVKFFFDLNVAANNGTSTDLKFTPQDYETARAVLRIPADDPVPLGYYCKEHPN